LRAVFALYELRQIAQVKKDLDSGLAPEAALQKLADSDKTGIVSKVIDAHKSQITRLNGLGICKAPRSRRRKAIPTRRAA